MPRVLIVNDNPHELTKLELQLLSLSSDFRMLGLTDPVEAMMRLRNESFDIMFVAYRMAVIDGLSVVRVANKIDQDIYINIIASQADAIFIKTQSTFNVCDNLILQPCEIYDLKHVLQQFNRITKLNYENKILASRLSTLTPQNQTAEHAKQH